MSLAPREKRVLADIEDSLRSTDPRLATMLAGFTVPRWWKIRQALSWQLAKICLTAIFLAATAAGLVLFGLLSAPARQQQCASPHQGLPGLTFAACPPPRGGPPSGTHPPGM